MIKSITTESEPKMQVSSTSVIYWTNDYGMFKFLHGNRDMDAGKIKKLMKDIQAGLNLLAFCPILVNETMHIIDGQHRYYVAQKLKMNVYYMVVPDFSLAQIAKMNNNQNRWKMQDFLNCYIDAGYNREDYKRLKDFKELYQITISLAVGLLASGNPENRMFLEAFRNGEFKATNAEAAECLMKAVWEFKPYTDEWRSRDFITAIDKLEKAKKVKLKEIIAKLKKHNLRIEKKSNVKGYLAHIEELFNFKNSIRKPIY